MEDGADAGMGLEFHVEKTPYVSPVPTFRMDKISIKGKISFVKTAGLEAVRFRAVDRHIKDREVQVIDVLSVEENEIERLLCCRAGLLRGAKE